MFVSVWVKISNSAYWAGTHTNPTLTITYDQTTTTSTVATNTTDWQLLSCVFTPATNYGQIEMKLTGASDATSPNNGIGLSENGGEFLTSQGGSVTYNLIASLSISTNLFSQMGSGFSTPFSLNPMPLS